MRVLVTGGAGFIGSHLTRALLEAGHDVRVLDNLSTGAWWRLQEVQSDIEWLEADIRNPEAVAQAVRGVEVVLHQAALPSVARSVADPVSSNDVNVNGTVTLLQACREAGVRRLVFAASSSAYGDTPILPKVEMMSSQPLSPYAASKLAGEYYCQVFAKLGLVETVCLRYFNVFGPRQDPNSQYAAVIPKFIQCALQGEPIPLNGDGTQSRDFTYIANVVQANLKAMTAPAASGSVCNIGCGQRYDLNTLIREVASVLGKEVEVRHQPSRTGDVAHSLADITRAQQLLGYEPEVDFREGLRRTAVWFQEEGLQLLAVR